MFYVRMHIKVDKNIINIRMLKSDHEKEFQNTEYAMFSKDHGISHKLSIPITPQ